MDLYIILGYLGSGKTTFVKNFLEMHKGKKTALIVNDFGQSDVDGILLSAYSDIVKSITNGSIFCSCRSDKFIEQCVDVANKNPDIILVEASGMANPASLFAVRDIILDKITNLKIKGVITIVDAFNIEKTLTTCATIKLQLAFADLIIINKTDLVSMSDIERITSTVRQINDKAKLIKTNYSNIDSENIQFCEVTDKVIPLITTDINTKKLRLETDKIVDYDNLLSLCQRWSVVAHRVKGIIMIGDKVYGFQYISGKGELTELAINSMSSYIIILAITKQNLKQAVADSLIDDKNHFSLT